MKLAFRVALAVLAATAVAAFGLIACTHTATTGRASSHPPRSTVTSPTATHSPTATLAAQCRSRVRPGSKPIIFRGNQSGERYCALLWSSDVVRDCATHAHGAKMIAFLDKHKCGVTRRALATVFVPDGRTVSQVNISSIETSFGGSSQSALDTASQFINLEVSPGDGGIDDLSRAGHRIPGTRGQVPPDAVPGTPLAGTNIDIIYAWYRDQATPENDYALQLLGEDVKFSQLVG